MTVYTYLLGLYFCLWIECFCFSFFLSASTFDVPRKSAYNSDNTRFLNPFQTPTSLPFYLVSWNPSGTLLYLLTAQELTHGTSISNVMILNPADPNVCVNNQLDSLQHQWRRYIDWPSPQHYMVGFDEPVPPFSFTSPPPPVYSQFLVTGDTYNQTLVNHITVDILGQSGDLPLIWAAPPHRSNIPVWWGVNSTLSTLIPVAAKLTNAWTMQLFQWTPRGTTLALHVASVTGQLSLVSVTTPSAFWTFLLSNGNLCVYLSCLQSGKTWNDQTSQCR